MIPETLLSQKHTIEQYYDMEGSRDKAGIADLVELRLLERYVWPVEGRIDPSDCFANGVPVPERDPKTKNGFASMALACLLIETIKYFRTGKPTKRGEEAKAINDFFKSENTLEELSGTTFYKDIRCGILHQGEVRNGWKIRRDGDLFNSQTKTINATKFIQAVAGSVKNYCRDLRDAEWDSEYPWQYCRATMKAIIENCVRKDNDA